MFFTLLGWGTLLVLALCFTIGGTLITLFASAWEGKTPWPALIPISIGGAMLYALFTNAPFHITIS